MSKKTGVEPTPCACSAYDALNPAELTEKAVEDGSFEVYTTGCTATTTREFAPGHDAKLKSFLIKFGALDFEIRHHAAGVASTADAETHAAKYAFGHMVMAGLKKAQAKAAARASRKAAKATHEGNETRQQRERTSLADVVAAEEAKHAAEVAASRPDPEWDDLVDEASAPQLEDEAAMNTQAREEREAGLVKAKVGRWTYEGVEQDGVFRYVNKDGQRKQATNYKLI